MINNPSVREIHRLLDRIQISPDLFLAWISSDDNNALYEHLRSLINYTEGHTPTKLYRFRSCSTNSFQALHEDLLYLTRADYFNDPYDCLLYFNADKLRNSILNFISDENLLKYLQSANIQFPIGDKFNTMDELLTFLLSKRDSFLDAVSEKFVSASNQLKESTFIACLTEDVTSPVMWAHYADCHKGFAIEYEFPKDFFYPNPYHVTNVDYDWFGWRSLLPVLYDKFKPEGTELAEWYCFCAMFQETYKTDTSPNLCAFANDLLLKTKLCLKKADIWSYEKEWRLVYTREWPIKIEDDRANTIYPASAIYLGSQISAENKTNLISIAKAKSIPVFETFVDYTSSTYALHTQMIAT